MMCLVGARQGASHRRGEARRIDGCFANDIVLRLVSPLRVHVVDFLNDIVMSFLGNLHNTRDQMRPLLDDARYFNKFRRK